MTVFKTIFFGTPDFSVPTLQMLASHPNIDLKLVVSMPDRPQGRGQKLQSPAVITFAKNNKLPFAQTENINKNEELINQLIEIKPDLIIVLAFAQFLSQKVLAIPSLGCFNIHTSLLPKYRGAAPIQFALLNGDSSTGVSIQKMVKKMDAGDLYFSLPVEIEKQDTSETLFYRLSQSASQACSHFLTTLSDMTNSKKNIHELAIAQNEDEVSFAPIIKKEDSFISFPCPFSSNEIYNRFRAYYPWPGITLLINEKRLMIKSCHPVLKNSLTQSISASTTAALLHCKGRLFFQTQEWQNSNEIIEIDTVQLEGKSAVSTNDFINGNSQLIYELFKN